MRIFGKHPLHCWHVMDSHEEVRPIHNGLSSKQVIVEAKQCCQCPAKKTDDVDRQYYGM